MNDTLFSKIKKYFFGAGARRFSGSAKRKLFAMAVFPVLLSLAFLSLIRSAGAFGGPTGIAGTGSGAIGVDAANNLSVGASAPLADTKFLITSPSAGASDYALRILQWGTSNPLFVVRSDGNVGIGTNASNQATVSIAGNIYSSGSFTGTIAAGNITSGAFGNNISGSPYNYAFPGSLGVGYPSQVGLPQTLSVTGGGYFSGNVGIGATNPGANLDVSVGSGQCCASSQTPNISLSQASNSNGNMAWLQFHNAGEAEAYIRLAGGGSGVRAGQRRLEIGDSQGVLTGLTVTGNVGIGTTGPNKRLEVREDNSATTVTAGVLVANPNITTDSRAGVVFLNYDNYGAAIWSPRTGSSAGKLIFGTNGGTGVAESNIAARMAIDSAGNVGIGTAGPVSKLDVEAGSGVPLFLRSTFQDKIHFIGGPAGIPHTLVDESGKGFRFYDATNGQTLVIGNTGNVGIGVTPTAKLTIGGAAGVDGIKFPDGTFQTTAAVGGASQWTTGSGGIIYYNGGNVGIGTTAPDEKLTVQSTIAFKDGSGATKGYVGLAGIDGSAPAGSLRVRGENGILFSVLGFPKAIIDGAGNVGIGTTGPTYKLDVASAGVLTARFGAASGDGIVVGGGAGKITAGTYDPLYTIGGKNYATYLPGMTGQKEETMGVIQIEKSKCKDQNDNEKSKICEYVLNFSDAAQGSDLWLFSKATNLKDNFDKLATLLTPSFDGKVWYEKDYQNLRLTFFVVPRESASSPRESALEISYRLTAPRFDAAEWSNNGNGSDSGLRVPE